MLIPANLTHHSQFWRHLPRAGALRHARDGHPGRAGHAAEPQDLQDRAQERGVPRHRQVHPPGMMSSGFDRRRIKNHSLLDKRDSNPSTVSYDLSTEEDREGGCGARRGVEVGEGEVPGRPRALRQEALAVRRSR